MNNTIDILSLIKYIQKKIHYVIIGFLVGVVAAMLINALTVKTVYTSEAKFYLTSSDEVVSYGALQATSTIMDDYLLMIESKTVVKRAIERNKLDMDEKDVMKMISATNPSKTHLLVLKVKAHDPRQVEEVMEAISYQIVNYIPSIMEGSSLTVFEDPETSKDEGTDKIVLNIIISVIIGILTAIIVLVIRFITNPTSDDPEAISREFNGINTYLIPKAHKRFLIRRIARQKKLENKIKSNLNELVYGIAISNNKPRVILITSPVGAEGSTYVASELCQVLRQQGVKVAHIGNNLKAIGKDESDDNCGQVNDSVFAMEQKDILKSVIDKMKDSNEIVVIDAAPVLQTPESLILAKYCDKVVVVVKYGETPIKVLRKTLQRFADTKHSVHAIVVNQYQ